MLRRLIIFLSGAALQACAPVGPDLSTLGSAANVALACREYANGLDTFAAAMEQGLVGQDAIARATVVRREVGPLCEDQSAGPAEAIGAARRGLTELLLLAGSR